MKVAARPRTGCSNDPPQRSPRCLTSPTASLPCFPSHKKRPCSTSSRALRERVSSSTMASCSLSAPPRPTGVQKRSMKVAAIQEIEEPRLHLRVRVGLEGSGAALAVTCTSFIASIVGLGLAAKSSSQSSLVPLGQQPDRLLDTLHATARAVATELVVVGVTVIGGAAICQVGTGSIASKERWRGLRRRGRLNAAVRRRGG